MDTPQPVPLGRAAASGPSPAGPAGKADTCGGSTLNGFLISILIILILIIAYCWYRAWRSRQLGPPADCNDYPSGPLKFMCDTGVDVCKKLKGRDAEACDAAVGACMPVARAAYDYTKTNTQGLGGAEDVASLFNRMAPHVPDCANAAYQISPAGAAKAFESLGIPVSLPPEIAPFYKDPKTRENVRRLAGLVPDAVDWSLDFGKNLPVKGSFTGGPSRDNFTASTPGDFASSCAPLCPRAECYADMGCGPQGYCQAYFADDPTYGGRCVPS